jgi:hypothetical protein
VRDDRIASVSVVFDARPFAPLFGRSTAAEPQEARGAHALRGMVGHWEVFAARACRRSR